MTFIAKSTKWVFSYRALLALTLMILLAGAAIIHPTRARASDTGGYLAIFEELEGAPNDKAFQAATAKLESYTASNLRETGADEALLRLGRIKAAKREYPAASAYFQKILVDYPSSKCKLDAIYELASVKFKTGSTSDAKAMLEGLAADSDANLTLRAKSSFMLKDIAASGLASNDNNEQGPPAIGVLLPFAGNYNKYGEEALRGIMLAADVFGASGMPVELIIKNADTDPAVAEAAVAELAAKKRIAGLVGPLLNAGSAEAAKTAQGSRIPMIALTQKDTITEAGDYVFRTSFTLEAQALAMADYAINTLGARNFGVLYPQKSYGIELAKTFEREVIKLGGTISTEVAYPASTTDFSSQIRQIFSVQIKEHKEGRRTIKEYEPKHKLDAVFIPDTYDNIALIAPYIEFFNVKNVQLLGAGGWNSQKLAERGDKSLEGAVFVDSFFVNGTRAGTAKFIAKFRDIYGFDPGPLEAQAFDAASLIINNAYHGMILPDFPNREEIKDGLKATKDFEGSSGALRYELNGELRRKPYFLTIKNRTISEAAARPPGAPTPVTAK